MQIWSIYGRNPSKNFGHFLGNEVSWKNSFEIYGSLKIPSSTFNAIDMYYIQGHPGQSVLTPNHLMIYEIKSKKKKSMIFYHIHY